MIFIFDIVILFIYHVIYSKYDIDDCIASLQIYHHCVELVVGTVYSKFRQKNKNNTVARHHQLVKSKVRLN